MKEIVILAFEGTPLSSIALPADIFLAAGVFWNRLFGLPEEPRFRVRIATLNGDPVRCHKTVSITPDCALADIGLPDLLIVSPLIDLHSPLLHSTAMHDMLRDLHSQGVHLASICTGAFLIAATGLLNGKKATTHWGLAKFFAKRYPQVILAAGQIVTDEGNLLCSGGANAGADLALHLVRRYCGNETAHRCARALLLDPERVSQAPYEVFSSARNHGDEEILTVQKWLEEHFREEIKIDDLAGKAAMGRRTFERRFKNATGDSPLHYLQRIRVEKAKYLLENGRETFDIITARVGYEDPSTFRRIFQKSTGLQPGSYREKFGCRV